MVQIRYKRSAPPPADAIAIITPRFMVLLFFWAACLATAAEAEARAEPVRVLVSIEDELDLVLVAEVDVCEPDDVIEPEEDPLVDDPDAAEEDPEDEDEPDEGLAGM
jgi:hypothetical protein